MPSHTFDMVATPLVLIKFKITRAATICQWIIVQLPIGFFMATLMLLLLLLLLKIIMNLKSKTWPWMEFSLNSFYSGCNLELKANPYWKIWEAPALQNKRYLLQEPARGRSSIGHLGLSIFGPSNVAQSFSFISPEISS